MPADLRVGVGDLVEVAALEPQAPGLDVGDRAHPVPLDLERPAVAGREGASPVRASIGTTRSGIGSRLGILGRVHPVDHPVVLRRARRGRSGTARSARAGARRGTSPRPCVRSHLCSSYVPRSQIVIVPAPYCPFGISPVELEVLERVVLGPAPRAGSPSGRAGSRSGSPTTRARRRARAAGPSAAGSRGAPGRRTAAPCPRRRLASPPARASPRSRACARTRSSFCRGTRS